MRMPDSEPYLSVSFFSEVLNSDLNHLPYPESSFDHLLKSCDCLVEVSRNAVQVLIVGFCNYSPPSSCN